MKKTIKIIDLLVKIANGEEVPKKIWFKNNFYEYDGENQNYVRSINFTVDFLIGEDITALLNDEVEIIEDEEDKKIAKIKLCYDTELEEFIAETEIYGDSFKEICHSSYDRMIMKKINEIIDRLNEMDKGE